MRELNINERNQLVELINMPGWQVLESVVSDAINSLLSPVNVDKTKSYKDIASDVIGRSYATVILTDTIKKISDLKIESIVIKKPLI
jgi:hypothetical protein